MGIIIKEFFFFFSLWQLFMGINCSVGVYSDVMHTCIKMLTERDYSERDFLQVWFCLLFNNQECFIMFKSLSVASLLYCFKTPVLIHLVFQKNIVAENDGFRIAYVDYTAERVYE